MFHKIEAAAEQNSILQHQINYFQTRPEMAARYKNPRDSNLILFTAGNYIRDPRNVLRFSFKFKIITNFLRPRPLYLYKKLSI